MNLPVKDTVVSGEGKRVKLTEAQRETLRVLNVDEWFLVREVDSEFSKTFSSLLDRRLLQRRKNSNGSVEISITGAGRSALAASKSGEKNA